jgi:glycosyltransferase involved in cell wall biosynthesis
MLVSVIIPTFNRAAFLPRAVRSVLDQSLHDFELIIVDDGSTDSTSEFLSTITDERVHVIRQENLGVSAARNCGLTAARGELLALLDSDDYWLAGKLEQQVRFMREGGWTVSQTGEIWIRNGQRVNQSKHHVSPCGWFFEKALEMCLISPSCVMLTREAWERFGPFDVRLPACEDFHLWLKVTAHVPVGFLSEKLTVKTGGHSDQLSRRIIGLDLFRIYALIDFLKEWAVTEEQRTCCLNALQHRGKLYRQGCLKRGRQTEAERIATLIDRYADRKTII